jgi:hypothetical protein
MKFSEMAASGGRRKANRSDPLGPNSDIGRKLKQYYDELTTEEVPDRFADLLRQLEERETAQPAQNGE